MGLSARQLASLISESSKSVSVHPGTINRLLNGETSSIKFLPELRDALSLPEDDLELKFEALRSDLVQALANVMNMFPVQVGDFADDVQGIARLLLYCSEAQLLVEKAEHEIRDQTSPPRGESLAWYDRLTRHAGEQQKARRKISDLIDTAMDRENTFAAVRNEREMRDSHGIED